MSAPSVAVIGIGTMGAPIARNLLRVGARLSCFDVKREVMAELVEHGAIATASPAEAASRAEFVITMLPADEHIRAAVLGPDGVSGSRTRLSALTCGFRLHVRTR
jgi:3-hydroxyisobutyrate dehydrogenase-like beta-hydroxyacid dehydrogenase